jgi:hypothetical protein
MKSVSYSLKSIAPLKPASLPESQEQVGLGKSDTGALFVTDPSGLLLAQFLLVG